MRRYAYRAYRFFGQRGGYSVVELMIVMSIIALVATVGALNMRYSGQKQQVELAIRHVLGQLQEARQQALSQSTDVVVNYSPSRLAIELRADLNRDGIYSPSEIRFHAISGIGNVQIYWPSAPGTFTASGAFASSTSSWEVRISERSGASTFIQVFPSGSMRKSALSIYNTES